MSELLNEYDNFIHAEMMTHPALFTHAGAKKIAIFDGKNDSLLLEVLKHPSVTDVWQLNALGDEEVYSSDPRFHFQPDKPIEWLAQLEPASLDIIISDNNPTAVLSNTFYENSLRALADNGILIRQCISQFNPLRLKATYQAVKKAGFSDLQILHFTLPGSPAGCGAAILALKNGSFKRLREKEIYNKSFATRYYNFDVHKASLALPEFIREDLHNITSS
ncbi:MAG: polyamine aminopropyltransferase [Gammaproteobacteria bacterium]|nr:polyamine aminopropyltransferase [Gammaproteobacteria bacterium]